jgi:hypothetical protein
MACLDPGRAVESSGLVLPVRIDEAAYALEDLVPSLVNRSAVGTCRAVAAITDRFESCAFEQTFVESVPDAGEPIRALEGRDTNEAMLDSWLAKGTVLGADGDYTVFVAFMDVMRRPQQGCWSVRTITVMGTRQPVASLLEEIDRDRELVPVRR